MIFDTLQLSEDLQPTFSPEQAQALTKALNKNAATSLATKADLTEQKIELIKWIVGAIAFNLLATAGLIVTLIKLIK